MRKLNLTKRLFWIIAFLVVVSNVFVTTYLYHQAQITTETRAYARAQSLKDYFIAMRYVYHKQFLESKIDLNDSTIGFCQRMLRPISAKSLKSAHHNK